MTVYVTQSVYLVSCLPEDADSGENWHWAIRVERTGPDIWAIRWAGRTWNHAMGHWDMEPSPSNRSDEWLRNARSDLATALAQATLLAPEVTVNGKTAEQYLAWRKVATDGPPLW